MRKQIKRKDGRNTIRQKKEMGTKMNRTRKKMVYGLIILMSFSVGLVLGLPDAVIDVRMDEFKEDKVLLPQYRSGVSYTMMLSNPHPDTIYSYMVDNWHYAKEVLEVFHRHRGTLLSGDEAVVVIAMADGTFIAAGIDLENQRLLPGYAAVPNQLRITEEFLAAAIAYMDKNSAEESFYYVMDFYLPAWAVFIFGAAALGSMGIMVRRGGGKK
jgi:hypothetical protein